MLARFADLAIDSDVPFEDLPEARGPADVVVRRGAIAPRADPPVQIWNDPEGAPWLSIGRTSGGYDLGFPELRCEISADGRHVIHAPSAISEPRLAHLLLHQVLPLAVSRFGRFVLHGCAVDTPMGAIAFVGESGAGKSTLAAAFCARGCALLADDALVVDLSAEGAIVWPTADGVRLWDDMRWLVPGVPAALDPWDKLHVRTPLAPGPSRLARVYEVGYDLGERAQITTVDSGAYRIALLSHLFRLDITDMAESRRLFESVHALASIVTGRRLAYRDGVQYIDEACAAVFADLASQHHASAD